MRHGSELAQLPEQQMFKNLDFDRFKHLYAFDPAMPPEHLASESPLSPLFNADMLAEDCWEWKRILRMPTGQERTNLCCPEDVVCRVCDRTQTPRILCPACEVPICRGCHHHVKDKCVPPAALSNGMWVGEPPQEYYTRMEIKSRLVM